LAPNPPPLLALSLFWVCLRIFLSHIFSLCLAFFPAPSWTLLCPDYIALFCLLLMCSNNVCRQGSPILSTVLFYPISLSTRNHTPSRTPQKSFRILYCIHLFIMRLLLFSLYPSFVISLVRRLSLYYMPAPHSHNTRKYMPSIVVVFFHSDTFLVRFSVVCHVLTKTKRQGCASQLLPRRPPLQPCTLARRMPVWSGSPRPACHDRQSRSFRYRC